MITAAKRPSTAALPSWQREHDFHCVPSSGYLGLYFVLMDGTAAYHNNVDTAERLDKAELQHMGSNMLGLTRGFGDRDLARTHSQDDAAFFTAFLQLIMYPMWLVWPLAGLAIAIMVVLGVLARHRGEPTLLRMLAGAAADLTARWCGPRSWGW
jgi:hypothetical protein